MTVENEKMHLQNMLLAPLQDFFARYQNEVTRAILIETQNDTSQIGLDIFDKLISDETAFLKSLELEGFLSNVSKEDFVKRFAEIIDKVTDLVFPGLLQDDPTRRQVRDLAFALVKAKQMTDTSSGLVFSGYAANDFFPSLTSITVDGVYFGQPKYWTTEQRVIDRQERRAFILPFAQREMVDRFILGIDSHFENHIINEVGQSVKTVCDTILSFVNKNQDRNVTLPNDLISELMEVVKRHFENTVLDHLKGFALRDTYDLLTAMPKSELAQMAESLVSVTSMKRRMSIESETVGGPIDVALITRSEGFIWIKRKHYFDPNQNPGFFSRHYSPKAVTGGNDVVSKSN